MATARTPRSLHLALFSAGSLTLGYLASLLVSWLEHDGTRVDMLLAYALPVPMLAYLTSLALHHLQRDQQDLARKSARQELAARGSGDGMFDWDLVGERVAYSEAFAGLFGFAPEEFDSTPDQWFARVHADDLPRLRADIDAHLGDPRKPFANEHRVRRKDGSWRWVFARGMAARGSEGKALRLSGWLTDIQERKRSEDQLRHHAFHDPLTGLPNRGLFMDRLGHALARARRNEHHRFAIVLLDLDRFKLVNDSLGHVAGDELLVAVGQRLESCLRPGDTVARMGGDEFMLLLEDVADLEHARGVAERIQRALAVPLPLAGHDMVASASIGIAVGDGSITEPHELLRDADTAMYEAKAQGSGQLVTFDARMHDRALERLHMESALRSAIERGELMVHYQPIVNLKSRAIVGFEALARWRHPSFGNVAPIRFIPLAEETGLIAGIGAWVLAEAARQASRLAQLFPSHPLTMHVNMSVRQMQQDATLIERVERVLKESQLPAERLTIEITESVIMEEAEKGERLLGALRNRGIHVCMDDFGTGYSSLSYLHKFRVDSLKIDISFVRDLALPDSGRAEMVRTILTMANTLGLGVVAEGIETRAQLDRLIELGCAEGQGFLFSPPVDGASIEALLRHPPDWS